MKKINTILHVIIIVSSALTVAACSTPKSFAQSQENISDVKTQISDANKKADSNVQSTMSVVVKNELYVDQKPINIKQQPSWLKTRISFHGDKLPFSFYSRNIVRPANILTRYQQRLDLSIEIVLSYTGDIQGALDLLAAKTGYSYQVNENSIYWEAFETKDFNIAFMPVSSNYLVGKDQNGSNDVQISRDNEVIKKGSSEKIPTQYSNLKATLSVVGDMKNTIQSMLSSEGQVFVSESTSYITVTDHPRNIETISSYFKQINPEVNNSAFAKLDALEDRGAAQQNLQTIILTTPYIVNNC